MVFTLWRGQARAGAHLLPLSARLQIEAARVTEIQIETAETSLGQSGQPLQTVGRAKGVFHNKKS